MLKLALTVLEDYYRSLESWADGANVEGYDVDVAYTKETLESVIYYLSIQDFSAACDELDFLYDLKEDVPVKSELAEAVDTIIYVLEDWKTQVVVEFGSLEGEPYRSCVQVRRVVMAQYPRIRLLRKNSGLSQTQFAKLIGMSQTGYSKYETGENDIPSSILIRIADHYDTSVDYLLGRTDRRSPYPKIR